MNRKQLITVFIAIGILSIMLIYPPWQFRIDSSRTKMVVSGPYQLVFLGVPKIPITSEGEYGKYFNNYSHSVWETEIDWVRLIFSIIVVILISSGFLLLFSRKDL